MMVDEDVLNDYMDIVLRVARRACYSSHAIDLDDLCQVGKMAVLRAIESYDPSCGTNIRSFVTHLVKQDVYGEAARFLGIFTVDRRVTHLASRVNQLTKSDKTDEEIADALTTKSRCIDVNHVKDLRFAYHHIKHYTIENDVAIVPDEATIEMILDIVMPNGIEIDILKHRILGDMSVAELSQHTGHSNSVIYIAERALRDRIVNAIKESA